jgi:hypothetical protein
MRIFDRTASYGSACRVINNQKNVFRIDEFAIEVEPMGERVRGVESHQ